MASKIKFISKGLGLIPYGVEAEQWLAKQPINSVVEGTFVKPRNIKFHGKFFAMLNVAYANYEWPTIETKWGTAKVSFDTFRKYVVAHAGHAEAYMTPSGEVRVTAKSLAFDEMDEDEFAQVYSDVLDYILQHYLANWTTGDMDHAINVMMGFTG